jgi:ubiquinone/menaquinone biosynthesis C-methylase UbiE/DNA-binding transcriptional ArsR family regulator
MDGWFIEDPPALEKLAAQPQSLMSWMESLADPTRLRLLRILERHELGVVELCGVLQSPQSTISRHLKILLDEGWLRSQRQGTSHFYRFIFDELDLARRRLWMVVREQTESWATVAQDRLRLTALLREKRQETRDSRAFFAGAAGQWDKLRGELYGDRFTTAAMLALLPPTSVVADLGCGTGRLLEEIAPYVGRAIGVDNSPAMLKAAKKRTAELQNVDLRAGELQSLPISDGECDAAMLLLALTYVAEPVVVLKEAARVLKPGGRVVIVDLLPHDRDDFRRQMDQLSMGIESENMKEMLYSAGFAESQIRPLPPESEAKGPALFLASGSNQSVR